jgi:hypothetical protein
MRPICCSLLSFMRLAAFPALLSDWSRYAGLRTLGATVLKLSEIGHVVPLSDTHLQRFIASWVSDAAVAELEVA